MTDTNWLTTMPDTFGTLTEAAEAALNWLATTPEWVTGVTVDVVLTPSKVGTYRVDKSGAVHLIEVG